MEERSEEIVFEPRKPSDDNSDLDPEEMESIRSLSAKLGADLRESEGGAGSGADDSSNLSHRRRTSRTLVRLQSELSELSGLASERKEEETDKGIMARTLADVGSHSVVGLQGVSLWLLDSENDNLVPKGWWHSPSMPKSRALERLFDSSKANYIPQKPVLPGADLAGILWNEASENDMAGQGERWGGRFSFAGRRSSISTPTSSRSSFFVRSTKSRRGSTNIGASVHSKGRRGSANIGASVHSKGRRGSADTGDIGASVHSRRGSVFGGRRSSFSLFNNSSSDPLEESLNWRDLKSLVDDPYTAKGPRLALLEKAGFHKATGITFKNDICQGIVIYYIANGLDEETLHSMANTLYLKQSAQWIGSCASMVRTRRATVGHAIKVGQSRLPIVKPSTEEKPESKDQCSLVPRRVKKLTRKVRGGGMQIPPSPNIFHVMWTLFGSFFAFLALSSLNQYVQYLSDDELFLILGPFGALVTLQYGLTAAPASQPRNAILGQALAGAVAMIFTYIPESILPVWIRQVVAPAIAIGVMVKCGFTHPPGGAHAVILSSGKYNWAIYGIALLGTCISIIPALIVNNLSDKRQYPTYWGFEFPGQKELTKKMKKMIPKKGRNAKTYSRKNTKPSDSSSEEV